MMAVEFMGEKNLEKPAAHTQVTHESPDLKPQRNQAYINLIIVEGYTTEYVT